MYVNAAYISEFTTVKADKNRYTICCKNGTCPWCLHTSVIGEAFKVIIRTFENTDPRVGNGRHKNLAARVLAKKIEDKVRVNCSNGRAAIREDIHVEFGVTISKSKAYRIAFTAINGSYEESYESLPQYCIDLATVNPDALAPKTIPTTLKILTMPM